MSGAGLTTREQRRKAMRPHSWRVVFRDEVMGFQKTEQVTAVGYSQAVTFAGDSLERKGYIRYSFAVIALERGAAVEEVGRPE